MKPVLVAKRHPKTGVPLEHETGVLVKTNELLVPKVQADGTTSFTIKPICLVLWNDDQGTLGYEDPGSLAWLEILSDADLEEEGDDEPEEDESEVLAPEVEEPKSNG